MNTLRRIEFYLDAPMPFIQNTGKLVSVVYWEVVPRVGEFVELVHEDGNTKVYRVERLFWQYAKKVVRVDVWA
jgi:hypothetical protein